MADDLILIDTSVLIDFFRKIDKSNSVLVSLVRKGYTYCISAVTEYEIYTGATPDQIDFWNNFLDRTVVLPFDKATANVAVDLTRTMKRTVILSPSRIFLSLQRPSPTRYLVPR